MSPATKLFWQHLLLNLTVIKKMETLLLFEQMAPYGNITQQIAMIPSSIDPSL
jgi:hypothetical protein